MPHPQTGIEHTLALQLQFPFKGLHDYIEKKILKPKSKVKKQTKTKKTGKLEGFILRVRRNYSTIISPCNRNVVIF